jgi:hypothetical protein
MWFLRLSIARSRPKFKKIYQISRHGSNRWIVLRNLASSQIWLNNLRHFGYNTKLTPNNKIKNKKTLLQTHFQHVIYYWAHSYKATWWGVEPIILCILIGRQNLVTRGVSHRSLAIYIKKSILWQKKNYENSNISPCKNIIFLKNKSSKRSQNPSRYHNSITQSQVSSTQEAKISSFKNPHIKIDLQLPRGQNPISYFTL